MDGKFLKLENGERIREMDPIGTLKDMGLKGDSVLLDYGSGTGIFTVPAAEMTNSCVYAYDVDDDMMAYVREKIKKQGLHNVICMTTREELASVPDGSVDFILLATVFHHIEDRALMFGDFKRLLNDRGTVAVIEFHHRETPMGPPVNHRVAKQEVIAGFRDNGYEMVKEILLGDNLYTMHFKSAL